MYIRCSQQWPKCWWVRGHTRQIYRNWEIGIVNWEILMKTTLLVFTAIYFPVLPTSASWHSLLDCQGWDSSTSANLQACLEDQFTRRICRFWGSMLTFECITRGHFWKCGTISQHWFQHTLAGNVTKWHEMHRSVLDNWKKKYESKNNTFKLPHGWGLGWFQCTPRA